MPQNIIFMMRGEPGWVERSDFTVPPPSPLVMPLPPMPPGENKWQIALYRHDSFTVLLSIFISFSLAEFVVWLHILCAEQPAPHRHTV